MVLVSIITLLFVVISAHVSLVSMVQNVNLIIDLVNQIFVGMVVHATNHQTQHLFVHV
jgi:hypothetical protein